MHPLQPREVRWERMFPDELEAAFAACPTLYLPQGMCEPHGPACALGLDALKAGALCEAAARASGGIVAPTDYWHIHELGGYAAWAERNIGEVARAWLTALPPWQHFKNLCYHLRAADALGFEAVIVLTGHYGPNWRDLKTLLGWVQPHVGARLLGLPDFEANAPGLHGQTGDHAGAVETSLLWALEPDCVDTSRFPSPDDARDAPHFALGPTARGANRVEGERMARDIAAYLGERAADLRAQFAANPPTVRLQTFAQVESLWAELVAPRLGELETMREWSDLPGAASEPSATSRWHANWPIPGTGEGAWLD